LGKSISLEYYHLEELTGMVVLPQYVMVVLKGSVPMAFGGTQEPAGYGELVSIGGLNPAVNKKLSSGISSILESKLSIPKSRFYLKFNDSKVGSEYFLLSAHSWGPFNLHQSSHINFVAC